MLLLISVVFVCCFLPFVGLEFFKAAAPGVYESMDDVSTSLYQLFWRSYLLNSAANPVIYLMCDLRFRKECLHIFSCQNSS
ncbi:unnamed protein product [Lymnaea stagnalis]|uniref:G-protein coupled receptors family 1 profile domain-containing protein n=1 Tax=Lymnaea stagnalis TaxID=6523 RepID=A0AAV2I7W3_LYMST